MHRVHIELDKHLTSGLEVDEQYRKLEDGDPSGSIWGEHVTSRMMGYEPEAIVVDSLSYTDDFDPSATDDAEWVKGAFIRRHCFAPPSIAQKLGKPVDLIGGDTTIFSSSFLELSAQQSAFEQLSPHIKTQGIFTGIGFMLAKMQAYHNQLIQEPSTRGTIDPLINAPKEFPTAKLSRRSFLFNASLIGVGVNFGAMFAPVVCAELPTHALDDLMELTEFQDKFRPDSGANRWVDGRTALMIEKAIEQSVLRDGAPVSVLMGNGHAHHAEVFLTDEKKRLDTIRSFAELMFERANSASNTYTQMTLDERRNEVFGELLLSSSFTVSPKGVKFIRRNNVHPYDSVAEIANEALKASKE